jgi:peroxiredoxin Q/BCP
MVALGKIPAAAPARGVLRGPGGIAETNKKLAEHVEADYAILSDPDKKAATAYGVVNADRPLAARWTFYIGPDGRILDVDAKVSPKTAGEDIVRKLEALKVPKGK